MSAPTAQDHSRYDACINELLRHLTLLDKDLSRLQNRFSAHLAAQAPHAYALDSTHELLTRLRNLEDVIDTIRPRAQADPLPLLALGPDSVDKLFVKHLP